MAKCPKRRRYKDNPYRINCENNIYFISFMDSQKRLQNIEIAKEIYDVFNKSELKDLSHMNEYDNHIEHLELPEEIITYKSLNKPLSLEEIVENNIIHSQLWLAIKKLPQIQKHRTILYFYKGMTLEKIAKLDNCSVTAVKHSLDDAIKNLKKILKN